MPMIKTFTAVKIGQLPRAAMNLIKFKFFQKNSLFLKE